MEKAPIVRWLKQYRDREGLTLEDISVKTGVSYTAVRYAESEDAGTTIGSYVQICEGLGINFLELIESLYPEDKILDIYIDKHERLVPSRFRFKYVYIDLWINILTTSITRARDTFNQILQIGFGDDDWKSIAHKIDTNILDLLLEPQYPLSAHLDSPKMVILPMHILVNEALSYRVITHEDSGKTLHYFRVASELKISDISSATDISNATLRRLENGEIQNTKWRDVIKLQRHYSSFNTDEWHSPPVFLMFYRAAQFEIFMQKRGVDSLTLRLSEEGEPISVRLAVEVFIKAIRWVQTRTDSLVYEREIRELLEPDNPK